MAFRFVRSAGSVHEPAVMLMAASGVIHVGGVVIRDVASNAVSPATATAVTTTNLVGVSMDYAQGASDTFVRVIPFVQGQLWEADCANTIATTQLFLRHSLVDDSNVRNITNTYETAATAVFLAYAMTGASTGSGKLIGTFLVHPGNIRSGDYAFR